MNRLSAIVTVESRDLSDTAVELKFADGRIERVKVTRLLMAEDMIRKVKKGDLKLFRALKAMNEIGETGEDGAVLASHLAEEWKDAPCMYLGVPNKSAMLLLTGLRKKVSGGLKQTKNGMAMRDSTTHDLYQAGLMHGSSGGHKRLYATNFNGLGVLRHWAEKNKRFAPYLAAYLPKDWEKREQERIAFALIEGKESGLYPPMSAHVP